MKNEKSKPTKNSQLVKSEQRVIDLIAKILNKTKSGKKYIFRGTPIEFDKCDENGKSLKQTRKDFVNSKIYRNHYNIGLFTEYFQPVDVEKEIVSKARNQLSPNASNIELLTDLRHFGGDTTLIDFSYDLLVAMFFACNGENKGNGQIILLPVDKYNKASEIKYEKQRTLENLLVRPARTPRSEVRIIAQSSIFIHAPKGFIPITNNEKHTISKNLKKPILEYLRDFHNVSVETIYNDLPGFLDNEKNYEDATLNFYRGNAKIRLDQYVHAIEDYDEAIRLNPELTEAYINRAICYITQDNYKSALTDLHKAIKLNPNDSIAYSYRGSTLAHFGRFDEAFNDFNKSLLHDPDNAHTYYNRCVANQKLGKVKEAAADYEKAMELDSSLPPLVVIAEDE